MARRTPITLMLLSLAWEWSGLLRWLDGRNGMPEDSCELGAEDREENECWERPSSSERTEGAAVPFIPLWAVASGPSWVLAKLQGSPWKHRKLARLRLSPEPGFPWKLPRLLALPRSSCS
eukprot:1161331-Pelagomonas_calceolata.AAC.1